jgi:hypothetical protein
VALVLTSDKETRVEKRKKQGQKRRTNLGYCDDPYAEEEVDWRGVGGGGGSRRPSNTRHTHARNSQVFSLQIPSPRPLLRSDPSRIATFPVPQVFLGFF